MMPAPAGTFNTFLSGRGETEIIFPRRIKLAAPSGADYNSHAVRAFTNAPEGGPKVLRHARQTTRVTRPAVVRSILTTALLLCVMSGALPAEAVLNPQGSMPCCRGMKGAGGECHGNSCPMHLRARAKSSARVKSDPVCVGARALRAAARQAPIALQEAARQETSRQEFAGAASLTRPCPSECCGTAAGSFTKLRRQRSEAAASDSLRPRPPTSEPQGHDRPVFIKVASALRRLHPPRAPPSGLDTRTA